MRFRVFAAFGLALPLFLAAQAQQPTSQPNPPVKTPPAKQSAGPNSGHHYTNGGGQRNHSTIRAALAPVGAGAKCRDGSYTTSRRAELAHVMAESRYG